MKLHYSGPASKPFWRLISGISDPTFRDLVYAEGVRLQETEERVISMLRTKASAGRGGYRPGAKATAVQP